MPHSELKRRAVAGAAVTYASQLVRMIVQFGSVVAMARLLRPADFGLFAMVAPVYGLVLLVQDFGLAQATIQRPTIDREQIGALFWINVGIGAGLALVLVVAAPAIGRFYGDGRAAALTRGFAAVMVAGALSAQHLALLNRALRFRYLAATDAVAFVLGTVGALVLAGWLHSYWALLAVPAITAVVTAIGAWAGAGFWPGLPRRGADVGGLLRLGGGVTGFNVLNFAARNMDNVLIGWAWGGVPLGLYDRAYKLLLFPLQQINGPLARVMMPLLGRLHDDPVRYRRAYVRSVQQLVLATQPGIVWAIATAGTLVPALLGEPWRGAAPIFQWLGIAALQQALSASATWLFISQGRGREYMLWGGINAGTSIAAFGIGLRWGPIGVAAAYSISQIGLRMPVMWWLATRAGPVRSRDLYGIALPHAAAAAASLLAVLALRRVFAGPVIAGLIASLAVSYAAALVALTAMPRGRGMLRDGIGLLHELRRPA